MLEVVGCVYAGYLGLDFGAGGLEFGDLRGGGGLSGACGFDASGAWGFFVFVPLPFLAFGLRGQPAKLYVPGSWVAEIPMTLTGEGDSVVTYMVIPVAESLFGEM